MNNSPLTNLIKSCANGDKIDLKKLCDTLNIKVVADANLKDLCKIGRDESRQAYIWLQPSVDPKTRFTLIAIAIAEFIIHPERISGAGISYDMFALADLHRKKHTPYMMLATRLAIPEHIIEKLIIAAELEFESKRVRDKTEKFDSEAYINNSIFLPEFIRCVVKDSTGKVLLENIEYKQG